MLHTLSHQWLTPSQATIINLDTGLATGGRTEVERRSQYFERIDKSRSDVLIPLIESCLSNLPKNRPSIVRVFDQLEGQLVGNAELTVSVLQEEIQQKEVEIQRNNAKIQQLTIELHDKVHALETLSSDMYKLQVTTSPLLPNNVCKYCIVIYYH